MKKFQQKVYPEKVFIWLPCSTRDDNHMMTIKLLGKIVLYFWRDQKKYNLKRINNSLPFFSFPLRWISNVFLKKIPK